MGVATLGLMVLGLLGADFPAQAQDLSGSLGIFVIQRVEFETGSYSAAYQQKLPDSGQHAVETVLPPDYVMGVGYQ